MKDRAHMSISARLNRVGTDSKVVHELAISSKSQLRELANALLAPDPAAVECAIAFLIMETRGQGHGRARALMSRRLKHCYLTSAQQSQLTTHIGRRLIAGEFSEQFKDQLRLALQIDPSHLFGIARECLASSNKQHVRQYAHWVLSHDSAWFKPLTAD